MAQWNPVIPKWAESKLIVPLNHVMTPAQWAYFKAEAYPVVLKLCMCGEDLYAVPTGLDVYACFCRLADLRDAGLDPNHYPQTLEELLEWGDKLLRRTTDGGIGRIGFLPAGLYTYAPAFGGGFYDWTRGKVLLNTPDNLRALTFLVEQRKKLGFANVIRFESGLGIGAGNAQWPFISGAYSITVDGQWRVEQIAKYAPELEYGTFPVPPPKGGKPKAGWANGNFMVIPAGARESKGAWEFIKFWSGIDNPERAAEFYTWGGWLPIFQSIADAPKYRAFVQKYPQFKTFLDVLPSENLQPTPPVPYQTYLWDRIIQADQAAQRGTLTPEAALVRLEQEVARELARSR
jgi:multiple sugar transport system substrate-binding protein